jgi:hypothetical protein
MKKVIKTMMMLFVASTFVLTSCTDDEDVKDVELTMIPAATSGTHFVSDTLKITLNAKGNADNKLKSIKITKAIAGQAGVITMYENTKLSGTDFIYNLKDTFESGEVGVNTYTITLTGEKGNAQTKTYTANVRAIGLIEATGSAVTMFGQTSASETPKFMSFASFSTYTLEQATATSNDALKKSIDMAYIYDAPGSRRHSFFSLDDAVMYTFWTGLSSFWTSADNKRITGFHKAVGEGNRFATISASGSDVDLLKYSDGKTFSKSVTDLKKNDLVLFKTTEGKLGLIVINEINGTSASSSTIVFDGMVQK